MESSDRFARASARINLEQCRKQAKDLVKAFAAGDKRALDLVRWNHPRFRGKIDADILAQPFALADAQLVVARMQHIESWPKLLEYLDALDNTDPAAQRFERAIDAIVTGNLPALEAMLRDTPALVHHRSTRAHRSTLLHYVAANGVENYRQITPPNIVDIARTLLNAGADVNAESGAYGGGSTTLGLTATSAHPRLAGVQLALIDLLIDRGAAIGIISTHEGIVRDAVANGCAEAATHLIRRGARADNIVGAAGLGLRDAVRDHVASASADARADALIIAAQCDHAPVVTLLLENGVNVNVISGMTPLHWASTNCNRSLMQLLVERGANLEAKNEYGGTVLSSTIWFADHALPVDFAQRDFAGTLEWLMQSGARTDLYASMLADIAAIRARSLSRH